MDWGIKTLEKKKSICYSRHVMERSILMEQKGRSTGTNQRRMKIYEIRYRRIRAGFIRISASVMKAADA